MITRREAVKSVAAASVGSTLGAAFSFAKTNRANLLFLCSDQHQTAATGCYGSSEAQTPHIDEIASDGVRFDRAYCNAPVCVPSRGSIITGLHPCRHGAKILRDPLPNEARTVAHYFKDHGRLRHRRDRQDALRRRDPAARLRPQAPSPRPRQTAHPGRAAGVSRRPVRELPRGRRLRDRAERFRLDPAGAVLSPTLSSPRSRSPSCARTRTAPSACGRRSTCRIRRWCRRSSTGTCTTESLSVCPSVPTGSWRTASRGT